MVLKTKRTVIYERTAMSILVFQLYVVVPKTPSRSAVLDSGVENGGRQSLLSGHSCLRVQALGNWNGSRRASDTHMNSRPRLNVVIKVL